MPLFAMIGFDGPDGARQRGEHRPEHVAYWTALDDEGRITLAGPVRNETNDASVGSVIIFEADDLQRAREVVQGDPFVGGGVFESLVVAPFKHVFPRKS